MDNENTLQSYWNTNASCIIAIYLVKKIQDRIFRKMKNIIIIILFVKEQ